MLTWVHEKSHADVDSSCGHEKAPFSCGRGSPWSLGRPKDSGFAADPGGSAPWLGNRGLGLDTDEFEPVDPCGEPRGLRGFKAQAEAWQTHPLRAKGSESARDPFGEVASRVWAESRPVGWPHCGGPLKTTLRDNLKSKAGSEVDASPGISSEAGKLLLPASKDPRGPQVPEGFKKNLRRWGRERQ